MFLKLQEQFKEYPKELPNGLDAELDILMVLVTVDNPDKWVIALVEHPLGVTTTHLLILATMLNNNLKLEFRTKLDRVTSWDLQIKLGNQWGFEKLAASKLE